MNGFKSELAKVGLDEFARTMRPHYEELMGQLVAASEVHLQDRRSEALQGRSNLAVIRQFIEVLPMARPDERHADSYSLGVEDVYATRILQSSLLWERADSGGYRPWYVVGRISDTKTHGPGRRLLLAPAGGGESD